jgi:hypothetical protein
MKRILFVATHYRMSERIYPIIPDLAKTYKLDLVKLYHMNPSQEWYGDDDLRKYLDRDYLHYFDNTYTNIDIDYSKYDLIIADDNRPYNGLPDIYRRRKCLLLSCSHGVTERGWEVSGKDNTFDGCFVFGNKEVTTDYQIPAGIPANDELKLYKDSDKKHILLIISYLGYEGVQPTGNPNKPNFKNFDKDVFDSMDLPYLQKKYNKEVVIKLKARPVSNIHKDTQYLSEVLPVGLQYTVLHDVYDDNKLIGESEIVISCPSTLALKPIQLQIPTVLLAHTGQHGIFADYPGIVECNTVDIHKVLETTPTAEYVNNILQGGTTFNSIKYYGDYIAQCIQQ